jgi:curved DNA-binding protein CbpA
MHATRALLAARDPYRVLGLAPGASRRAVRARYLALAKLLHPDSMPPGAPPGAFADLAAAYEQLAAGPEAGAGGGGGGVWGVRAEPWRRDWFEDDDGELLMRLRRDYAGGRGGAPA